MSGADHKDEELDRMLAEVPEAPAPEGPCLDDSILIAYTAKQLNEQQIAEVEKHLASCPACRALTAELRVPVAEQLSGWAEQQWAAQTPKKQRPWVRLAAAGMAAAAAIALFVLQPQTIPVPEYSMSGPLGGLAELRSEETPGEIFVPTSQLKVLLKPASDYEGASPELFAFVVEEAGRYRAVPAETITRGQGGAFRFEARAGDLFGQKFGRRELLFVLAPPGSDPPDPAQQKSEHRPLKIELVYKE